MNRDLIYVDNLPSYAYLIGDAISSFEDKLPREIDVLRYYFHFQNQDEKVKISNITKEIQQLYNRSRIPTIHFESIRSKVKLLVASTKSIIETRKSKKPNQIRKELSTFQKLGKLFEVAQSNNVLSVMQNDFLMDQRASRQMFVYCLQQSTFDALKSEWPYIKARGFQYKPCEEDELECILLLPLYNDAKKTLLKHAKSKFIRDDYAELTDLCLKFFGIQTKKGFMVPGSISKSRWMSKAIYSLKMYLFREHLGLEEDFAHELLQLTLFISLIYCKHWNQCTNTLDAPVNDLKLIEEIQIFSEYNERIARSVLGSFKNHLWYLGEELVVLALFSEKVSFEDKNRMRNRLASSTYPARAEDSFRLKNYVEGVKLPDLITARSRFLFSLLELDASFLNEEAETWKYNSSYKKSRDLVRELIVVVNDPAERALGRATTIINNQKARSEETFQNMFLSLYSDD